MLFKARKYKFNYIFAVKCWYMKKNQVFRVEKNVQILCSTGILQWKGGAHGPRIEWRSTNETRVLEGIHSLLAPMLHQLQSQLQACGSFTCTGTTAAGPVGSVWSRRHGRPEGVSESRNNRWKRGTLRILHKHPSVYPQSLSCTRHAQQVSYTQRT